MAPLGVAFILQIEDQVLVEFDLSVVLDPFNLNGFILCPRVISFFQKLCRACFYPVSCSFPEPYLRPQCCLYNILAGQPENSWPLGGNYCTISKPLRYSGLHLPCFLQHVCQQHLSVNPLGQVTGTQCLVGVHLLVTSLQGQFGFQRQCLLLHFGVSPAGCLGSNLYHPSCKATKIPLIKLPLHFYGTSDLLPLINLFLSHLPTLTTRTLPPCRQHCSTPLIIKILLTPLTGPDNPLLCHYFHYYLE